ncbi:MAG: IS110 family transposase [Kiritimatiellae bacterium]|nr:IS110 family transposase [Kiritimatiellia bacterium]
MRFAGCARPAGGYMLPKCDAGGFHRHLDEIPQSEYWKFEPLVDRLESLAENISMYDWKIQDYADVHFKEDVELLRTIPGVGPITSCAYAAFAPDPKKFGSPRDAGCYFGLTAGQDQSGDIDKPKKITKGGNEMMRKLLVNAANYILRESSKDSALKRYGERICTRGGKIARRKAKIAVARKLAVVMMAMLQSRKPYQDNLAARQETADPASV